MNKEDNSSGKGEIQKIVGINTPMIVPETKYYVKYKNLSYRDCKYITHKELLSYPAGKKFESKLLQQPYPFRAVSFLPGLYKPVTYEFNEGYITAEKIISERFQNGKYQFLVKWISLDYDECTWEDNNENLPQDLLHDYFRGKEIVNEACSKSSDGSLIPPKILNLDNNRNISKFVPLKRSPQLKNEHVLSDFQLDGVNWIYLNWIQHQNCILADEMGLGKTIQSLCFLLVLKKIYGIKGPFLILTPLSTVPNWINEIDEWTNFRTVCLTGNAQSRKIIEQYCLYYNTNDQSKLIFDILIVPFDTVKKEMSIIKKIFFVCLIIDEAHRLKNSSTDIYHLCKEIKTDFTLLMTGTPVQNDIHELWSILHFINPQVFPDFESFDSKYSNKEDRRTIESLQDAIKPFILRRKKSDIKEIETPLKEETIVEVEMTPFQRTLYKSILNENRDILVQSILKTKASMKNISIELRKVCNHPYLLKDAENTFITQYKKSRNISENALNTSEIILNALIYASGKTILLDKLLPKLLEGKHKVLIFSQMTKMLDILDDYLYSKQYKYERLDGNKNYKMRKLAIERFKTNSDLFIFLLSTRAGGLGLNLTEADTVIIYDNDFNPQNDLQAQARVHRIGQKKNVKTYRLIMKDTYEAIMFDYASKKLALDYAILDYHGNESGKSAGSLEDQTSARDLEMILKKGAYYTLNENPDEHEKFCEENIDQILKERSHVINLDYTSGGNSRFSKVSFEANQTDHLNQNEFSRKDQEAIFESPEFWSNLLPQGQIYEDEISDQRERRKTFRFYYSDEHSDNDEETSLLKNESKSDSETFSENENEKKHRRRRRKSGDVDEDFIEDLSSTADDDESENFDSIKNFDDDLFDENKNQKRSKKQSKSLLHQSVSASKILTVNSQQKSSSQLQPQQSQPQLEVTAMPPEQQQQNVQQVDGKITPEQLEKLKKDCEKELNYVANEKFKESILLFCNFGLYGFRFIKKSPIKEFSKYILLSLIQMTEGKEKEWSVEYIKKVKPKLLKKLNLNETINVSKVNEESIYRGAIQLATSFHEIDENMKIKQNPALQKVHVIKRDDFEIMKNEIGPNTKYLLMILGQKAPTVESIFKKIKFYDSAYRAAVYVSNEHLPRNFYFASSFPFSKYSFWTIDMDFFFLCGLVIYGLANINHLFSDQKFPFCLLPQDILPDPKELNIKFNLMMKEVNVLIPEDYNFEGKVINDFSYFKRMNWFLFSKTSISLNLKKVIIRGIYYYGIPFNENNDYRSNKRIIDKMKFVFRSNCIDDFTFSLFVSAILVYCKKYQPEIEVGPFNIPVRIIIRKPNKEDEVFCIDPKEKIKYDYDLRWIKEDRIIEIAKNVLIFQKVRKNHRYFNEKVARSLITTSSFDFPKWESKDEFIQSYWGKGADIKLFNITAAFGFLLFSEFGKIFLKLPDKVFAEWKLKEVNLVRPINPKCAQQIESLFKCDLKIERLETILKTIHQNELINGEFDIINPIFFNF